MADVDIVLAGKYPAKPHAKAVVKWMREKSPNVSGVLYLEGQKTRMLEDNDSEAPFRSVTLSVYPCVRPSFHDTRLNLLLQTTEVLLLLDRVPTS